MKISGSDMMLGMQNIQKINNTTSALANAKLVTDSNDNVVKADISETGRRIGQMMGKMERMGGPKIEERMTQIKTSIEELGLSNLDLDNMSDEEIAEVADKINDVMESFKPKDIEGQAIDLDSMSSDDIKSFVSTFKNNASEVLDSIGKMEGMMNGRPPMGGKPPAGGKPPVDNNQNAVNLYTSYDTTDEEEQLSVLETLVEALENNESSDSYTDISEFQQLIGEYLLTEEE